MYMAQFPLLATLCLPFVSPSTYLAPSSCDRNRPPRSQVACKLTPFAPPFTQLSPPPLPNPQNPNCPAPTKDDLGNIPALAIRNNKKATRNYVNIPTQETGLSSLSQNS
jgi:hypothetical protein